MASEEENRRAQFWIQGNTDFNKGKTPRWSISHPYYVAYIQGYEDARRRKKEKDAQYRRDNSWWNSIKQKVAQWLRNW